MIEYGFNLYESSIGFLNLSVLENGGESECDLNQKLFKCD